MGSKLRNLAAIEFRQRRTQLLVCLLAAVGGTLYCIAFASAGDGRNVSVVLGTAGFLYGIFAPIFLAMRTSLGEATDRTRSFSDGLPISARWRGAIRLAGGAGVLVVPIAVGAMLLSTWLGLGWLQEAVYTQAFQRPDLLRPLSDMGMVWLETAVIAWSATSFYLVLSLLGTTLRAEAQLGYCGAVAAFIWMLGVPFREQLRETGYRAIGILIGAIAPQSIDVGLFYRYRNESLYDLSILQTVLYPLLANTVVQFVLAALFVRRYSRRLPSSAARPAKKTAWRFSPQFRPSTRNLALVWLAWRQSVPMCLPGLAIACLLAASHMRFAPQAEDWQRFADSMPRSVAQIGILWSVVVGAGVFSSEIDWRIGEFWRTRPISAGRLFGIKFVAGLLAVWLVLDGPAIVATWWSPHWGQGNDSMNWRYIACFLPLHAVMFAIAVAWTCSLRQAVLGGMAALATVLCTELALNWFGATSRFSLVGAYDHLTNGKIDFAHGYPIVMAELVLTMTAAILIGRRALGRYDPRRQTG